MEVNEDTPQLLPAGRLLELLVSERLEAEDSVHLLARRTAELARLLGRDRRRKVGLLDLDVAPQLVLLDLKGNLISLVYTIGPHV